MNTPFEMFRVAIREFCASSCSRAACGCACPFWSWSEHRRQAMIFIGRRERIAVARRFVAQAAGR